MGISEARDLEAVRAGFTRWLRAARPDAPDFSVAPVGQPATGLSSETLLIDVDWSAGRSSEQDEIRESLVARLPPAGDGLFPDYDLAAQGRVQEIVAAAGLPAVVPLAVELDPGWLGAPFLLMPRVAGRVVRNDKPFLRTGWLAESDAADQSRLHEGFLDLLAGIHRIDVDAAELGFLPGASARPGATLAGELERWRRYLAWAAEGDAPAVFGDALRWCGDRLPDPEPPASLLWGDVQLGNILVGEDMTITAVLDFEMASVGPCELDLAWHLVLHQMTVDRCGGDLPGFPDRTATIEAYRSRLDRDLRDLKWFEVFAALRSGAIMVRAARLLARLGIDDSWLTAGNPTVTLLADLIAG
ncbi:MAG TPA: phosphotransferase family protein [Acidimicrobiales bacterium]|nr:phosphotransferase family protein [Acidimicrobiales bacterium]